MMPWLLFLNFWYTCPSILWTLEKLWRPIFSQSTAIKPLILTSGLLYLSNNLSAAEPITTQITGVPSLQQTAQGVVVVPITPPNVEGISHNRFQQFTVADPGVVLNNSIQPIDSQLAGKITANPYLTNGSAQIILNEVVGKFPSQLQGAVEVAGPPTPVIIANPYGISVNGCQFINSPRVSLITGSPQFNDNGLLDHFQLSENSFSLWGRGWDARAQQQVNIISQAITIQAPLQGGQTVTLMVPPKTSNHTELDSLLPEKSSAMRPTGSLLTIDAALFGSRYPQQITLIGSPQGLGVNTEGNRWLQPQLQLQDPGHLVALPRAVPTPYSLENHSTISAQQVLLYSSGNLHNQGTLEAEQQLHLLAENQLTNRKATLRGEQVTLATQGELTIEASQLTAKQQVNLSANGNLVIQTIGKTCPTTRDSKRFSAKPKVRWNKNQLISGGDIKLTTKRQLKIQGGQLQAAGQIQLVGAQGVTILAAQQQLPSQIPLTGNLAYGEWQQKLTRSLPSKLVSHGPLQIQAGCEQQVAPLTIGGSHLLVGDLNQALASSLQLSATGDLTIQAAVQQTQQQLSLKHPGRLTLRRQADWQQQQQTALPSTLTSQGTLSLQAGANLRIIGSQLRSRYQLQLLSADGMELSPLTTQQQSHCQTKQRQPFGFQSLSWSRKLLGTGKQQQFIHQQQKLPLITTLSSQQGEILLQTANTANLYGNQIKASKELMISASSINLRPAISKLQQLSQQQQRQHGLTIELSGPLTDIIDVALQIPKIKQQLVDINQRKLGLLEGGIQLLEGEQALSDCLQIWQCASKHPFNVLSLDYLLLRQQKKSASQQLQQRIQLNHLQAGTTLHLLARAPASNNGSKMAGNLDIQGSHLLGKTIILEAQNRLNLQAATTQCKQHEEQHQNMGKGGFNTDLIPLFTPISAIGAIKQQRECQQQQAAINLPTTVVSQQLLRLHSGQQIRLRGAQCYAQQLQVTARHLTLTSPQDDQSFSYQQKQLQGKSWITQLGGFVNGGNHHSSQQQQLINQPTGFLIGSDGFSIKVQGHTQLNGAFIVSQAPRKANDFSSATLDYQNITCNTQRQLQPNSLSLSIKTPWNNIFSAATAQFANRLLAHHYQGNQQSVIDPWISPTTVSLQEPGSIRSMPIRARYPSYPLSALVDPSITLKHLQRPSPLLQGTHRLSGQLVNRILKAYPPATKH
ncbi:MAG: hemagglutinin repeat-containing protein [Candidatus Symbiodolus clandestinus]